jgi:hypothetical protein
MHRFKRSYPVAMGGFLELTIQIVRDSMPNLPNPDKPVLAQRPPVRRSYGSEGDPAPGAAAKRKSRFIGHLLP